MKKNGCIHPMIMEALASVGHGDQILIADGNYPLESKCPDCRRVYLGLRAGEPTVTAVLETILCEINVEAAAVMKPDGIRPEIYDEFQQSLSGITLEEFSRWDFYDAAAKPTVRLAISTGEKRTFANLLITVGCA
ncbi:RbsD or FucU transport [Lachnospiraceae bacterium]|jgi:hypothetical protein|nr:RbsD or FucU transport [Lachnospiraceae bacterium]